MNMIPTSLRLIHTTTISQTLILLSFPFHSVIPLARYHPLHPHLIETCISAPKCRDTITSPTLCDNFYTIQDNYQGQDYNVKISKEPADMHSLYISRRNGIL